MRGADFGDRRTGPLSHEALGRGRDRAVLGRDEIPGWDVLPGRLARDLLEDREIELLIKKQEQTGLKSITDGENRRKSWQTDFVSALPGIETLAAVGGR